MKAATIRRLLVPAALVVSVAGGSVASAVTAAPSGADGSSAAAATKTVRMNDETFSPATVTIGKGSSIRWTNNSGRTHTTTSVKKKADGSRLWNRVVSDGGSYTRKFGKAGTFRYFCAFHDGMVGKVVVTS